jgi:acetyl esterase
MTMAALTPVIEPPPSPAVARPRPRIPWRALTMVGALAVIWIVFSITTGGTFLMPRNLSLLARQRDGPHISCQVLLNPVTDAGFDTPSYRQFARGYWLTREAMMWFWDQCMPDRAARRQPLASPLRATADQLEGFPPTLVVTGELDILRDEGEAFARKLTEAGVETTAVRFLGAIHDFMMLEALADTPAARGCIDLTCDLLRNTFAR